MNTELKVKCPHCGLLSLYSESNKFRPFCSERCKLIDLGQWASESYKIPLQARPEPQDPEFHQVAPDELNSDEFNGE